ncbi:Uncharacterised domain UPF0702, alpha/beta domain protein [Acididesulfobacillus acetoxydans]|uniref:Uncharacterized domain UPF0702, alpha/beta domain protein n=1 Tax=Acididesulfobacillus acetoxydans TaxID=1561005 RepID=A0A8S0WWE8_9FIRM|nr:DUF421 domain-containing protein [Acididesulfobacillus acetoxydans]CAA7600231.1 Uncharacterised domain UPF0702, alpha/beta domain protein [Acididesulfobacillus acetoxydans]CEJ09609.1 Hypothetical protein DEACI_4094 [Acididesulfobacillus acetoxydans]
MSNQSVSKIDLARGPDLSGRGEGPFTEIIVDGEVDKDKLRNTKHDNTWLGEQLKNLGASSSEDVLFLAVNPLGEVIADLHRREGLADKSRR